MKKSKPLRRPTGNFSVKIEMGLLSKYDAEKGVFKGEPLFYGMRIWTPDHRVLIEEEFPTGQGYWKPKSSVSLTGSKAPRGIE